jgi:LuxR family maltose regulon positive regulatory protein
VTESAVGVFSGFRGRFAGPAPDLWLPLLNAKLAPPRVPAHAVPRPRLGERFGGSWRVALVTGAPGTGKTLAVSQWFESLPTSRRAWVSLDPTDDRPAQFWLTVLAALDRAAPGAFPRTASLASGGHNGDEPFLVELAVEISGLDPPAVLVLEDLHAIRDRRILDGVAFLVDRVADEFRLVITSRADPRLPVGRWRTRAWFVEIRQGELGFTPDEAGTLFAAMGEHRLDPDDIEHLTKHTEGWAAALQLAALSMRDRDDPSAVARRLTGRHHMIADLLLTEVLERQPDDVREFLLTV